MTNWAGKRLGKVRVESLLARGGVAEIYIGTHTALDRKVAVKILRNLSEDNSDALLRFQREARVVAKLRHPNIVQVYDFDTIENDPYLVMEFIQGPSLSQYLKTLHQNGERLPLLHVVRLISAVASALQYAHNNGVIHRDIKPGNILLTSPSSPVEIGKPLPEDFEPVLTDFGLVRFLDANRETTTGRIAGTPAYMSPEQARGERTDGRTDVYSLGIVLYEALAGHIPFDGETTMGILLKQVTEPPPPIPDLSPFIENVLARALAKDPKERFQTPLEFANALRGAINTENEHSTLQLDTLPEPLPPLKVEPPPKARPQWMRFALLGILAIALGGFIFAGGLPSLPGKDPTSTVPLPSETYTLPTAANTVTQTASYSLGPIGILRFQNAAGLADQATLIASAMPAPPAGSQYEVWLRNEDEQISLGILSPDETGKGEMTFSEPEGSDLLARYNKVEITIEPKPDSDPAPSALVAYSFTFPTEGLTHIRYLLAAFPNTPDQTALIQGLYSEIKEIADLTQQMQIEYEAGSRAGAKQKAESAFNLLVGAQSSEYKDWNGDGVTDPKKSYGLLLNGNNFGYIQAAYAEANFTVSTSDATQYMISNGEVVKACTQDLAAWAPRLHDTLLKVLTSTSDAEVAGAIREAVALADQMLNGIDQDMNGNVEAIAGECGAQLAYEYAYYMADMPLLPTSPSYQLTAVAAATSSPLAVTPTRSGSQNSGNTPVQNPTRKPNPTKKPHPTQKPKNSNAP
jgi:serine/threonine protein kinase